MSRFSVTGPVYEPPNWSSPQIFVSVEALPDLGAAVDEAGTRLYNPPPENQRITGSTFMAHHKSAEKRIRQTVKRTAINRARTSRIKTAVKHVEAMIASGNRTDAEAALKAAQPELQSGVSKGSLHRNTASRKISRLSKRIKAL
jgi:small subunit ribosomal protein S20